MHRKAIAVFIGFKADQNLTRGIIFDAQRTQEIKVANFVRPSHALRGQRLGGQFDIAGPGDQSCPVEGAVVV